MSRKITVYCNDEDIMLSWVEYGDQKVYGSYGDTIELNVDDGSYVAIYALANFGCKFVKWIYRTELGDDKPVYSLEANPIWSDGDAFDIYARAVGEPDTGTDTWTFSTGDLGTVSTSKSTSIYLNAAYFHRYAVRFSQSGTARFYTTGSTDTYGYLSDTASIPNGRKPSSYINSSDDNGSGLNFSFVHKVELNKTYYVWVRGSDRETTGLTHLNVELHSDNTSTVAMWDWNVSNRNASAKETQKAHKALTENGNVNDFSYVVWNDLVDKVYDMLEYKDMVWDNTYRTYTNTQMKPSDKVLRATRYNSVVHNLRRVIKNIDSQYDTILPIVTRGQKVYGSHLLTIASEINYWITGL